MRATLALAAAALFLSSSPASAQASPPSPAPAAADRIWTGGPILTMNDAAMRAEAIAESGGRIVAVGSRAEVMKLKGRKTRVIDLKGRTIVPGFVDPHGHVGMGGFQALSANLLAPPDGEVTSIAELQATLRTWVEDNKAVVQKVNLIVGFGYDSSTLKELRHPTRDELDAIARDIPVIILHQSGHLSVLNSKALENVGYGAATKDPAGGVIRRREGSQEPNGVLEETAHYNALYKLLPAVGPEGFKTFAREGAKLWARFGYTTAQDGRTSPGSIQMLQEVAADGGFPIDITAYPDVLLGREPIKQSVSSQYVNRFRVAGAKLTIDGSPQGFTAWRDRPYYKPVGDYPAGYSGYAAASAEQVMSAISWASENGIQIIVHSNGERATDLLIASHKAAQARFPKARDLRPVLIHGQFLREDQLDSMKELGIIPSLFPMHTFYWGDWHLEHTAGPKDGANISPTGWALQRGMIFTSHHDAPVAFPDSMRVLDATVTRRARGSGRVVGPEHRVDVITGLKSMTLWAAYQHGEEGLKGSLEVGKVADFAILARDPTAVDPTTLSGIKVTETVKEGTTVFRLSPADARKAAAGDSGESLSRLLYAMAHPALPAGSMWAARAAQPSPEASSCQSDVVLRMMDAMARGGDR